MLVSITVIYSHTGFEICAGECNSSCTDILVLKTYGGEHDKGFATNQALIIMLMGCITVVDQPSWSLSCAGEHNSSCAAVMVLKC